MSAQENKHLMKGLFEELAKGHSRPYLAALSPDFELTVTGQTPWSGTYKGPQVRAFRLAHEDTGQGAARAQARERDASAHGRVRRRSQGEQRVRTGIGVAREREVRGA